MARGLYVVDQLPPIDVAARAAVASFTAAQDIYGSPQKILPKMRMDVGLTLELYAHGEYSTTATPTASVGFWFNGAALAVPTSILGQTQLAVPGGTTVTSAHWEAYWRGKLRAIGTGAAGGTWKGRGWAILGATTTPFITATPWFIPTTLALTTVTCDVTADRAVGVLWQWGASSASNTVTVDDFEARCSS
jgi:hypothetical protein